MQREVEPESIKTAGDVIATVRTVGESFLSGAGSGDKLADLVAKTGIKVASTAVANNMARLVALSKRFNPGAPGQAGPTNAFVYTCRCGWIDMGHFFISAAGAFAAAYAQQLGLTVEGKPYTQGQLMALGLDRLAPWLEPLLNTVAPGGRGREILAQQRELFESGEPRDISLALGGYTTEYYQQLGKLFADPLKHVPAWLKSEQLSAFTMEDLPSDCYGADMGQKLWRRVSNLREGLDLSPLHDMMSGFFEECQATSPTETALCEMMAETTPGSCRLVDGKTQWSDKGLPRQHTTTAPYLLESAKRHKLCGDQEALPCESGRGAGSQLPVATLDVSPETRRATLTLPGEINLFQPAERGEFGGEFRIPGRSDRINPRAPLVLGTTRLTVSSKGSLFVTSTLRGVPGLGETRLSVQANVLSGQLWAGARGGILDVEATADLRLDYKGLFAEVLDLTSPEAARFRRVLESDAFKSLLRSFIGGDVELDEFYAQARALVKAEFAEGLTTAAQVLLDRIVTQVRNELGAIYTGLKGRGTVRAFGLLPISYFTIAKGTGRTSPLWGTEFGFLTSELFNRRLAAGGKAWLYGERLLQSQASAGVDLFSRKGFAEVSAKNRTLTGMDLNLRIRYEVSPAGEQQFLLTLGGQHELWGSKPGGER